MCCFSGTVSFVAKTRIFARPTGGGRQAVVYAMNMAADSALAMILPLPVRRASDPKEFKFINLEAYPEFFADMEKGFPRPLEPATRSRSLPAAAPETLDVVSVGHFEASFVPTLGDFGRLDERFRIDPAVWRSLPGYDAMGFAVFKLKPGRQKVHPMSFEFPREDVSQLFFPTLHIHDGTVHEREEFDHVLFAQGNAEEKPDILNWEESKGWANQFMKTERAAGLLENEGHVYRKRLRGTLPNRDTYLAIV